MKSGAAKRSMVGSNSMGSLEHIPDSNHMRIENCLSDEESESNVEVSPHFKVVNLNY